MWKTFVNAAFLLVARHRNTIVRLFQIIYLIFVVVLVVGSVSILRNDPEWFRWYALGKEAGEYAILLYVATLVPGIFRRFGVTHKLVAILMMFRRYLGITMYLFVLMHFAWVTLMPAVAAHRDWFPTQITPLAGLAAGALLLTLFVTSNDVSTKALGVWWERVHSLTYPAIGLIFLHVVLQVVNVWTILIGLAALAEIASFIALALRRKKAMNAV